MLSWFHFDHFRQTARSRFDGDEADVSLWRVCNPTAEILPAANSIILVRELLPDAASPSSSGSFWEMKKKIQTAEHYKNPVVFFFFFLARINKSDRFSGLFDEINPGLLNNSADVTWSRWLRNRFSSMTNEKRNTQTLTRNVFMGSLSQSCSI